MTVYFICFHLAHPLRSGGYTTNITNATKHASGMRGILARITGRPEAHRRGGGLQRRRRWHGPQRVLHVGRVGHFRSASREVSNSKLSVLLCLHTLYMAYGDSKCESATPG